MSNESRRKLLKSFAAGSGAVVAGKSLPDSWHRPVVDSVILPGHAETSGVRTITCQDDPSLCDGTYAGTLNGIPRDNRLPTCAGFGSDGSGGNGADINVVIGGDGSVSPNLGANTTLSGNSFELEWQNTGATQSDTLGTTCELWLVLNGTLTPGSNQIQVQETWEWRCTGTINCTNQFDAGVITLTLV